MFDRNRFIALVEKDFKFLETKFGFVPKGYDDYSRGVEVLYRKNELLIKIRYSYTNDYVEVYIYNHISVVRPGAYSWKYSVDLSSIIKKYTDMFPDFKLVNKKEIEVRTHVHAKLLEKYGEKILSEEDWFSWGELSGYNQYVPPDLP